MALFLPVLLAGCTWREALSTCVFQSDFGFVLNCAFKKSALFRVRNLGGVKGFVGLGELNMGAIMSVNSILFNSIITFADRTVLRSINFTLEIVKKTNDLDKI